jgi:hypothetical protein
MKNRNTVWKVSYRTVDNYLYTTTSISPNSTLYFFEWIFVWKEGYDAKYFQVDPKTGNVTTAQSLPVGDYLVDAIAQIPSGDKDRARVCSLFIPHLIGKSRITMVTKLSDMFSLRKDRHLGGCGDLVQWDPVRLAALRLPGCGTHDRNSRSRWFAIDRYQYWRLHPVYQFVQPPVHDR